VALNRWAVLFWGICISFILLIFIPEDQDVIRSLSVTMIAVTCLGYYLYERYSKKLTIQADLIICLNTLLQFLIPVFFLVPYYSSKPELDIWSHRYGFAITSFAAFLGQTMFFWGYESIRPGLFFPSVKDTMNKVKMTRFIRVIVFLGGVVWVSRIILLQTGTYYHLNTSDFQFTSPYFSVLTQLSNYGNLVVGALFLLAFSETNNYQRSRKMKLAIVMFILEIGYFLPSGSRTTLIFTFLFPIIAYILVMNRIPVKTIILSLLLGAPIFFILGEYRYITAEFTSASVVDFKRLPDSFNSTLERTETVELVDKSYIVVNRMYDGMNLNHLLSHYSNDYDYEFGKTYINVIYIFIPRFIFTSKPVFTMALGGWYTLVSSGSTPITFWGESYINFSWFGIIICSFLLGIFIKYFDYLFVKMADKPFWCFVYLYCAIKIFLLPMEAFVIWMSYLTKFILIAFLLTLLYSHVSAKQKGLLNSKN